MTKKAMTKKVVTKLLSILVLGMVGTAFAAGQELEQESWAVELQEYQAAIQTYSNLHLGLSMAAHSAALVASCSASAVVVAGSFLTESFPVINFFPELFANAVDENYITFPNDEWEWDQAARGVAGGAVVSLVDLAEFILLWLAGEEDRSFQSFKKVYASTFAVAETLFAEQGQCLMSFLKLLITGEELDTRQTPEDMQKLWGDVLY